ncbi:transcriptional regulator, ArsR family [Pseudomonas syringae]|uniref:Transcriptional regulator, ArsR family n=2 Tax=Pseudomonas syringae TaxID=317 RepID=A0AB38C1T4_PSESX|nr:transcriptional regulator, ArsR family [Pseudomonas syringae]SFP01805.1 transcriptional regulator, ArsR family [Pseudomonas syringae]
MTYICKFGYPNIQIERLMYLSPVTLFKCLGDETRTRIMLMLAAQGELCVCELIWALDDNQPKVSRHLAQLRTCGLLEDRRQGQWIYYRLHPQLPVWVLDVLQVTLKANHAWVDQDSNRLESMQDRPVRQAACC